MPELIEVANGLAFPEGPDRHARRLGRAGRDVRSPPDPCPARRVQGDDRRDPRRAERRRPRSGRAVLRVQQRRPLHRDRHGGAHVPRRADEGEVHRRAHPDRRSGHRHRHRPLHRVRRAPAAGAQRPRLRRPRRLLLHRPRPRRRRGAGAQDRRASTTPRPTGRASRRSSSRPTTPTASGCRPTAPRCTGPRRGGAGIQQRTISAPGEVVAPGLVDTSQCLYGFPGFQLLDSLAVDSAGNVCVATIVNGGVSVVSPAGRARRLRRDRRSDHHQRVLRRRRPHHRVHHVVDDGTPREDDVATSRTRPSSTSTPDPTASRPRAGHPELTTVSRSVLRTSGRHGLPCRRKGNRRINRGTFACRAATRIHRPHAAGVTTCGHR